MNEPKIWKTIIADDHPLIVEGLENLLSRIPQITVVATASNGNELKEKIKIHQPCLVISDINMSGLNGLEICEWLKLAYPEIKIILISMFYSTSLINRLMQLKADGYLLKNSSEDDIKTCIAAVLKGETCFYNDYTKPSTESFLLPDNYLSDREKDVLKLIALGLSNTEIKDELKISDFTVETLRKSVIQKLGTHNIADLVSFAQNMGL